ncbi:MAG: HAD hydrolase-like protein [bacterium]
MIQILMDIDETMVSVPPGVNVLSSKKMFKKVFNVDAHEDLINNIGKTEMSIIPEVLLKVGVIIEKVPTKAYFIWSQTLRKELLLNPVRVLPGISEFLQALTLLPKVKLKLLTGNAPLRAMEKLSSGNIEKYFLKPDGSLDGVFGNEATKREMLFDILKSRGNKDDKFVIVDDSLLGAEMGKKYSIPMILVATGKATEKELKTYSENVFPDLGENRWKKAILIIESL